MPAPQDILCFEDVTVTFDGIPAVRNLSFRMRPAETRIVFGAAGSGKSVMLKTAIGLLRPESGRVSLFGDDITHLNEFDMFPIRSKVGILFQEGGLFDSMTIEENVSYPLIYQQVSKRVNGDIGQRVRETLRFVELEHTLEKFPSELSGGMRRRVGIARANVTEPQLMLYDSPTAGLDPITANTIINLIIKARDTRNTASILVTHRYQDGHRMANFRYNPERGEVEPAGPRGGDIHSRTTFMVFGEGRLVFEGTQEELESSTDPYVSKFKAVKV